MKINNCFKNFHSGISKVISPKQTCVIILKKFKAHNPLIMDRYFEVKRPTGIPQYRIEESAYCQHILKKITILYHGTNGKGHCKQQALASGLMELAERYSSARWMLDKRNICKITSFKELRKNLFTIDDFYSNFNKDFVKLLDNIDMDSIKIEWNKGYTIDGKLVYLPHLLLGLLGSTGLAAGNSFEEALLHGICEVIERHCRTLIEMYKIETPTIDITTIVSPIVCSLLKKFAVLKKQKIIIKDFSLDFGLPVIGMIRTMGNDTCTITTGVATTPEEALIRALTENSQVEGGDDPTVNVKQSYAKHHFTNKKVISIDGVPDISNCNIKTEIEVINKLLLHKKMRFFFLDTTNKILDISSVSVYIQRAKDMFYGVDQMTNQELTGCFLDYFMKSGNYDAFERCLKEGLSERYISETEEHYRRGRILEIKSKYKKATSHFLKIFDFLNKLSKKELRKNSQIRSSFINLGLCYQAIGDKKTAFNYYLQHIDLYPNFNIQELKWNYEKIKLPENNKRLFEEAIDTYRQAVIFNSLLRKTRKYKSKVR